MHQAKYTICERMVWEQWREILLELDETLRRDRARERLSGWFGDTPDIDQMVDALFPIKMLRPPPRSDQTWALAKDWLTEPGAGREASLRKMAEGAIVRGVVYSQSYQDNRLLDALVDLCIQRKWVSPLQKATQHWIGAVLSHERAVRPADSLDSLLRGGMDVRQRVRGTQHTLLEILALPYQIDWPLANQKHNRKQAVGALLGRGETWDCVSLDGAPEEVREQITHHPAVVRRQLAQVAGAQNEVSDKRRTPRF